ncbi:MAG: class I SAM-dependent methyltransferase [Roseimicrobium sp.]
MQDELQRGYYLRFNAIEAYRRQVWTILTRDFFSKWIPANSEVLDLGCGWGEFINQVSAATKHGMDLNPESRHKLSKDVRFHEHDCSTPWPVADGSLDVVFTSNFFEHLFTKDALRSTLSHARKALKPGGRLICLGPNIRHLKGHYWDFWDHYLALTEESLAEGLALTGFDVKEKIGRFLPYSMSQGSNPPLWMVSLYLKMPWAWRFFGKQFLLVAEHPQKS